MKELTLPDPARRGGIRARAGQPMKRRLLDIRGHHLDQTQDGTAKTSLSLQGVLRTALLLHPSRQLPQFQLRYHIPTTVRWAGDEPRSRPRPGHGSWARPLVRAAWARSKSQEMPRQARQLPSRSFLGKAQMRMATQKTRDQTDRRRSERPEKQPWQHCSITHTSAA